MSRTFFWQICEAVNCTWQWVFFGIALFVTAFTVISVIQTFRYHKKFVFELVPLGMNVFSMFLLTLLHILSKNFQFHLAAYQIEIYTYFLFCYSFTTLYLSGAYGKKKGVKICSNIVFGIVTLTMIALVILVFAGKLSASCEREFMASFYSFFSIEGVLYIVTVVFGILICKELRKSLKKSKKSASFSSRGSNDQDTYIKERTRQIALIMAAYTVSICLRVLWAILYETKNQTSIECVLADDTVYVLKSLDGTGQFIIILNEVTQMPPHLLLPIALYVIPSSNFKKGTKIQLQQDLLQNPQQPEEEEDVSSPYMKSQLSSILGSSGNI